MHISMKELLEITGHTRVGLTQLISRKHVRTDYAKPAPGLPRYFSRENALELAFMSAVLPICTDADIAARAAAELMQYERQGHLAENYALNARIGPFDEAKMLSAVPFNDNQMPVEALRTVLLDREPEGGLGHAEEPSADDFAASDQHYDQWTPSSILIISAGTIVRRIDHYLQKGGC